MATPAFVPGAKARYEELVDARRPFLTRAREAAALTIPYLVPPDGFSSTQTLNTPYQSHGARGVRTLASKLLQALFPSTPFFKYLVNDDLLRRVNQRAEAVKAQAAAAGAPVPADSTSADAKKGEAEMAMAARERAIMREINLTAFSPYAFTALQHLIVAGNHLLYIPADPKERLKGFRLDQYVVKRDPSGALLEVLVEEGVTANTLPEEARSLLDNGAGVKKTSENTVYSLYTHMRRASDGTDKWEIYQELEGKIVPGSEGTYRLDEAPFLPLRLSTQPGEDYGRSYVEEYLGDLDSLEGLTEAIVEGSAASARVVFMVNPNGVTSLRVIQDAANLAIVPGRADDVTTMQTQKAADLRTAYEHAQTLAQALSFAFLMNVAVQRSGERVTAEEIRYLASELDAALGGVYTLLASEFQLPVVRAFSRRMEKRTGTPPLPADLAAPQIITGLEAIGRGQDQRNLKMFIQDVLQVLGPERVLPYLDIQELIKRSAASYSVEVEGLLKSAEQVAQEQQANAQMQMLQQAAPQGVAQIGGAIRDAMKNQTPQQPQVPNGG